MKKISIGLLIFSLLLPLLIGAISAALSSQGMAQYAGMEKPPLSPPPWVFSVAWTILYIMMGIASYYIFEANTDMRSRLIAIVLYEVQLFMNFLWSIIFFNWGMYLFAFIWLMVMWCIVIVCAYKFFWIKKLSAILLIPYILWLTFAAYLNFGAYILSRDA